MSSSARHGRRLGWCLASTSVAIALIGCNPGCGASKQPQERYTVQRAFGGLAAEGLELGDYAIGSDAVVDGDTIEVIGADQSLRLLGIDTEETFKNRTDRRAAASDFKGYLARKRGDSPRPAKAATPMGEAAKDFAKAFFKGVKTVRLERDHPKAIRGGYSRYLTYVFAKKNDQWVNYNVEAVRAGMSPYFMKYGYSTRFHDAFIAAEKEARANKRGIWAPDAKGYADYDERIAWWTARAEFLKKFADRDDHVNLSHWDALQRIEDHLGNRVTVIGTVEDAHRLGKGLTKVKLGIKRFESLPVIFFKREAIEQSGIEDHEREFVAIRGNVAKYKGQLQIEVHGADQVQLSKLPTSNKVQ